MNRFSRRRLLGCLSAFVAVGCQRLTRAQEQAIGPRSHPELYWEVVYRCPNGHEQIMYKAKDYFDPSSERADSDYCGPCYVEWMSKRFPPAEYVEFRDVRPRSPKQ